MPISDTSLAKLVLENVRSHGIIGLTTDGTIVAWAAGAEDITGHTPEQAIGQKFGLLFSDADRAAGVPEMEIQTALNEGRAEDSRWHSRRDGSVFWGNGVTVDLGENGLLTKIFRDETPAKRAEEQRVLLLNELNHRVKNTLATVQAVVEQTLRSEGVEKHIRQGLTNRLIALSSAHDVLVDENWAGANLETLIWDVLAAYDREPSPISMQGPAVRVHPSQAVSISLAFHELATNAAKYGALGTANGKVEVQWNLAHNGQGERFLTMLWREHGGPVVVPPTKSGFGSNLIARTFAGEHGGRADITYPPEGARCVMVLPLRDEIETPVEGGQSDPAELSFGTHSSGS